MNRFFLAMVLFCTSAWGAEKPVEVTPVTFNRPIWTVGLDEPDWIFPFRKSANTTRISFFGFALVHRPATGAAPQPLGDGGEASRALPLYLAERLFMETDCLVSTNILVASGSGPVVSGRAWDMDVLFSVKSDKPPNLILNGVIEKDDKAQRVSVVVQLWDAKRKKQLKMFKAASLMHPVATLPVIEAELINYFVENKICKRITPPRVFAAPKSTELMPYVLALEDLFMQTLAENKLVSAESLRVDGDVLQSYLSLQRSEPGLLAPRLMYTRGVLASGQYKGSGFQSYLPGLINYYQDTSDETLSLLSPFVFSGVQQPALCEHKKKQLQLYKDIDYRNWLSKVICDLKKGSEI